MNAAMRILLVDDDVSIQRAVAGSPTAADVVAKKGSAAHPFAAHL